MNILNSGLDAELADRSLLQRIRVTNVVSLVIFALVIPFAVLNVFLDSPRVDYSLAATMVFSIANIWLLRWRRDPVLSAHIGIFIGYSILILTNVFARDLGDPSFGWLYLLAIAAVLTIGPRGGWIWIAILLATTVGLWLLSAYGFVLDDAVAGEIHLRALVHRLGAILAAGLLTTIAVSFQRQTEKSLEAEISVRMRAEQDARDADRVKGELLANVSHEIRTPMNGVIGMTDLLLKADLPPAQQRQVEAIDTSAETLLALVNDLLDFSKMEAGKLSLYVMDFGLRDLVEKTIALLAPRAAEKGIELRIEVDDSLPSKLFGDSQRLRQVLLNLLGNAIRFTPEGSVTVQVEHSRSPQDEIWLRFAVTDTGVGISSADQAGLFAPFSQVGEATTAMFGGTGLGLAISKSLVELMGGEIGLESATGVGSTFWFRLPLWEAQKPDGQPVRPTKPASENIGLSEENHRGNFRVLVVDDDEINRLVAENQLKELGYVTETVNSGPQALVSFAHGAYDAILMDCQMPELDGYETTRQIRHLEADRGDTQEKVTIIAVTAHAMKGERERCLEAGMDDYVSKPLRSEDLRSILDRWLTEGEHGSGTGTESFEPEPEPEPEPDTEPDDALDPGSLAAVRQLSRKTGKDLVGRMFEIYREEGPKRIGMMQQALLEKDAPNLAKTAHALGGSAVYLGASSLANLCRELEDLAERNHLTGCESKLQAVEKEHQRVLRHIRTL